MPLAGGKATGAPPTMTRTTKRTSWSSTTMMMTRTSSSSPPRKPPARWRRSTASSGRICGNYRKLLAFVTFGVLVETLFNVIMPLSLKFLIDDALGEEDFQALYKILGVLAVAGIITSIIAVWYERWDARLAASHHCRRAVAAVRARPEPAVVLFCPYQARRDPLALLDRPRGLRRLDQDLCQQRGAAVPGIDRRHHPDAVLELAARGGGAAGVSDHADRAADPDAEGGAGELRAEARTNRRCSARCRRTWRRRRWSRRSACSAARSAGSPCATRKCASRPRPPSSSPRWWSAPSPFRSCCCTSWCWRSAPISPPRARSPSAPSSPSRARSGRCPTTSPI